MTVANTGMARPTKRSRAVRSNTGDSSSTAIASITSSTNGRYRSVRVTETNVSNEPSTTPASSRDSSAFNGGAPGRANAHMPCSEKSNPARVSFGVSSSNSPRTSTVSVDIGLDRRRGRQHQIRHPLTGEDGDPSGRRLSGRRARGVSGGSCRGHRRSSLSKSSDRAAANSVMRRSYVSLSRSS